VTIDRGHSSVDFGLIISAYGIGSLLGAVFTSRLGRQRIGLRMVGAYLVTASLYVALSFVEPVPILFLIALTVGVMNAVVLISYITLRAGVTPDELMGRVGSTARTLSLGIQPIGMLAGGAFIELTNGAAALAVMGGLGIAVSVLFGLGRTFREAGH
jgi:hypothetical protein